LKNFVKCYNRLDFFIFTCLDNEGRVLNSARDEDNKDDIKRQGEGRYPYPSNLCYEES